MNRLQGLAVLSMLVLSASACAPKEKQHESFLQIDSSFQTYVSNFEQAAADAGTPLTVSDLVLTFGATSSLNETGVCEWAENETPRIIVNQRIWNTLSDDDRQEVIFHELGHCVLRRVHQNGEMLAYNGTTTVPASVMYPYRISGIIYRDNIDHYHAELLDSGKRNQF